MFFLFRSCDPLHQLYKQLVALRLSKRLDEVEDASVSSDHNNDFVTYFYQCFISLSHEASGSFALLVCVASRARSLSLSVNLKSNYTRLRSQAITQFVVIPGASISATAIEAEATGNSDSSLQIKSSSLQIFLLISLQTL